MKKQVGIALATAFIGTAAIADAPKITFEIKSELNKQTSTEETTANEDNKEDESMRFQIPYARVNVKGKINDELSYRVKFRLNKAFTPKKDGVPSALDYAYIDHKMSDTFKLRIGKQYINQAGWEGTYSSKDSYGAGGGVFDHADASFYRAGLGFFFNMGNNDLNIQIANNSFDETNQTGMVMGFQWTGHFMDGSLNPMITYHQDTRTEQDPAGTAGEDFKANSMTETTIGLQYKKDMLKVELDYGTLAIDQKNNATGAPDDDSKVQATVLRVAYNMGKMTPILKYKMDTTESAGEDFSKATGYSLAVEYAPFEKTSFKYFVSTSSVTTTDETTAKADDVTAGDMVLGFVGKF